MEILVGLSMASIVILGVGTGYLFITKGWVDHQARVQAQQSLRSAEAAITREFRISGACMGITWVDQNSPLASNFTMLQGTSGPPDTITTTSNPKCAGPVKLTATCSACQTISVDNILNFAVGDWAFIGKGVPTQLGEYFQIQSVDSTAKTVTSTTVLTGTYVATDDSNPTFLAGADQRTFKISSTCTGCNGIPTLVVRTLSDTADQPIIKGVDSMTVRYVLNRTYISNPSQCNAQLPGSSNPLCIVNLPETAPSITGDWKLVRGLIFTLGGRSILTVRAAGSADGFYHLTGSFELSPRNFIFSPNARIPWMP